MSGEIAMDTNEIGKIIKTLRRKKDMTQTDVAHALNVASSTISNWEHGRRLPSVDELKRVASLFKVSFNVFHVGHETDSDHVHIEKDVVVQIIDFKPLGIRITRYEGVAVVVACALIMLSNLMPFELVFAFHLVGLFVIIAIFSMIFGRILNQKQLPSKRIQYPVHFHVYYEHESKTNVKRTDTLLRVLFLSMIAIVTIGFVILYVLLLEYESNILNMIISLIGLVYLIIHFLAYRALVAHKIIRRHVPYYLVHKRFRYLTLYTALIIDVMFLSVYNMVVSIRIDLFRFDGWYFLVGFSGFLSSILAFYAVVAYNRHIGGFGIAANKGKLRIDD
jgi:transcriptional regulator with XRE-family HTH domain